MLLNIPQIEASHDPVENIVSLAGPWSCLQYHRHEDHRLLCIPYSLSRPPKFLCKILDKPLAHCTLRGAVPRSRLDDEETPPNLLDTIVLDAPIHVATIVLMNVVVIHLDKAAVRLRWDEHFQVCPLLG